jgi:hypothetical protein
LKSLAGNAVTIRERRNANNEERRKGQKQQQRAAKAERAQHPAPPMSE